MSQRRARATLVAGCLIHFLHDGCSDLLYALFPVWAREFSLSFAQVGVLRSGYSGALALFQVPAGFLAERWGEPRVLVAGTFVTAVGFLSLGTAGGFALLLALSKILFSRDFAAGYLSEQETVCFLEMTDKRNATAHTYREEVAEAIFGSLKDYSEATDRLLRSIGAPS